MGMSHVVSLGEMADVDFGDMLFRRLPGRFGVCFALTRQNSKAPMALAEEAPAEDWRAR